MQNYRKIYTSFWTGKTGQQMRQLGTLVHFMAVYLFSNPHANMLGIYHLPIVCLAQDMGITPKKAAQALNKLSELGFCHFDQRSEYIWIIKMATYQIENTLKPQDNRVKHIQKLYESLPALPFLADFYQMYHAYFHLKPRPKQHVDTHKSTDESTVDGLLVYIPSTYFKGRQA